VLLLHLLVRHLELLAVQELLHRHVDEGEKAHHQQQQAHAGDDPGGQLPDAGLQRLQHEGGKLFGVGADELPGHHEHHHGDAEELAGVDQLLFGKQPAKALEWVEAAEVGHEGLGAERVAAGGHGGADGHRKHQQAQWQIQHEALREAVDQALQHLAGLLQRGVVEAQLVLQRGAQFFETGGREHQQDQRTAAQHHEVGQVLGTRHLAVRARPGGIHGAGSLDR